MGKYFKLLIQEFAFAVDQDLVVAVIAFVKPDKIHVSFSIHDSKSSEQLLAEYLLVDFLLEILNIVKIQDDIMLNVKGVLKGLGKGILGPHGRPASDATDLTSTSCTLIKSCKT
ncbi:unnamed protein product [Rotaria sp. Silwood1]|nr:unnamed protein product [Rotaria sp. Silwood1]